MENLLELKESGRLRYGLLAVGFMLYILFFLLLFDSLGETIGAFTLLPLLLASWLFEVKGGLYTLTFIIPLHGFLYTLFNEPFLGSIVSDLPGFAPVLLVLLAIGAASRIYTENKCIQSELIKENEIRKEREMLLQETNHRFKNNLSMVAGMMELELMETTDDSVQEVLKQSISRIKSLAELHDVVSWTSNAGQVNLSSIIKKLSNSINNTFYEKKQVSVIIDTEEVVINVEEASSYSLILNELLTNSYKHAFSDQEHGTIKIELSNENDILKLKIKDNGKGLPVNFDLDQISQNSLGMMLVKNLIEKLDATLRIGDPQKAEFIIEKKLS